MVRRNDLVGSDAIEVVKGTPFPLECSIRKSVNNFDFSFPDFIFKNSSFLSTNREPFAQLCAKKNITDGYGERDQAGYSAYWLQFLGTWPAYFKGFIQDCASPSKLGRKISRNVCDEDRLSGIFHFVSDVKGKGLMKGRVIKSFCDEGSIEKEEKDLSMEFLVGFLFDPINHNFRKLNFHEQSSRLQLDEATVWDARITKKFNHVSRLASILEGKRADANEFWGNMKFARLGGVLPFCSIASVASSDKEDSNGEERNAAVLERNGGNALPNVANGLATRKPMPLGISVRSFLKSACAGGISCAMSTALMHPVDTLKTQVQATTLSSPALLSKLPELGIRGLYRGSIPAILGQFFSHGLRTGIFEASKLVLSNFAPTLTGLRVQSISSFCGTFLGTVLRIPCEVLKQRLQAGLYNNVGEAFTCTCHQDGLKGFFRGTGPTLLRELPFYVAGMGLYSESKKVAQHLLRRELEPWETMAVGALSGGFTAVLTTPIDVVKTRMMTAHGANLPLLLVGVSIIRDEGLLGLFRGSVPRFFWVAPLGALNFAGYELILEAMDGGKENQ